jgi:hypothetical protein
LTAQVIFDTPAKAITNTRVVVLGRTREEIQPTMCYVLIITPHFNDLKSELWRRVGVGIVPESKLVHEGRIVRLS